LENNNLGGKFMHIIEGYLPMEWCAIWLIISLAVAVYGAKQYRDNFSGDNDALKLLLLCGVFAFFVSLVFGWQSLKGSYSHACATGLLTVFFGPSITALVTFVVAFLQAIILAFGGLTTLGASVFSVGVLGPLCGYMLWKQLRTRNVNMVISVFLVTLVINIFAMIASAFELAVVYAEPNFISAFIMFFEIYVVYQIPWLIIDCVLTTVAFIICQKIFGQFIDKNDLLNKFRW
jgi:cobalt/nickel transport system permease protein